MVQRGFVRLRSFCHQQRFEVARQACFHHPVPGAFESTSAQPIDWVGFGFDAVNVRERSERSQPVCGSVSTTCIVELYVMTQRGHSTELPAATLLKTLGLGVGIAMIAHTSSTSDDSRLFHPIASRRNSRTRSTKEAAPFTIRTVRARRKSRNRPKGTPLVWQCLFRRFSSTESSTNPITASWS